MRTPFTLFQDYVIVPVIKKSRKINDNILEALQKFADFSFERSQQVSIIMLAATAISILSSHLAQINGLKKGKRENKDYLIKQEKKELSLDTFLTIIPPFIINRQLTKALESGKLSTQEARETLTKKVSVGPGISRNNIYNIDHIRPIKEIFASIGHNIIDFSIKKFPDMPDSIKNNIKSFDGKLNKIIPDEVTKSPCSTLERIAADFDHYSSKTSSRKVVADLYNKNAYDDLCGQNNGMLIMATFLYTIVASNIVIPVLKNILANKSYEKHLRKIGETKDSIKRKKRFENLENVDLYENKNSIFDIYLKTDISSNILMNEKTKKNAEYLSRPFKEFDTYNSIISNTTGLKI